MPHPSPGIHRCKCKLVDQLEPFNPSQAIRIPIHFRSGAIDGGRQAVYFGGLGLGREALGGRSGEGKWNERVIHAQLLRQPGCGGAIRPYINSLLLRLDRSSQIIVHEERVRMGWVKRVPTDARERCCVEIVVERLTGWEVHALVDGRCMGVRVKHTVRQCLRLGVSMGGGERDMRGVIVCHRGRRSAQLGMAGLGGYVDVLAR